MKRGFLLSNTSKPRKDAPVDAKTTPIMPPKVIRIPTGPVLPPDTSKTIGDFEKLGDHMVVTWLPLASQLRRFIDPISVALVYPSVKEAILALPNFPAPYTPTPLPPRCDIGSVSGKGFGVFATANLKPGDLIITERPLILIPVFLPWVEGAQPPAIHPDALLELAVKQLGPAEILFRQLHNCKGPDKSLVRGIFDTNGICIGALPGYNGTYGAVGFQISRFNHRYENQPQFLHVK